MRTLQQRVNLLLIPVNIYKLTVLDECVYGRSLFLQDGDEKHTLVQIPPGARDIPICLNVTVDSGDNQTPLILRFDNGNETSPDLLSTTGSEVPLVDPSGKVVATVSISNAPGILPGSEPIRTFTPDSLRVQRVKRNDVDKVRKPVVWRKGQVPHEPSDTPNPSDSSDEEIF